jgi:hypothetical protein
MKTLNNEKSKTIILSVMIIIFFCIGCVVEMRGQAFTHDPSKISLLPTDSKKKKIEIKNNTGMHEVFIVYRYKPEDRYWSEVGTVSILDESIGTFYVEEGYEYGTNVEWSKPKKLGAESKKRWKTPKRNRDRYSDYRD